MPANEPGLKRTEAWKKTPANHAGFLYLVIVLSVVMFFVHAMGALAAKVF